MATPSLSIELLQHFSPVFTFILVLVLIYAALQSTKVLGANKIIHSIIALVISFIIVLSPKISGAILFAAPWFAVLFIFVIFGLMGFKIFGVSDDNIADVMKNHPGLQWTLLIIMIIIVIGALSVTFGQDQLDAGQGTVPSDGTVANTQFANQNQQAGSTATGSYQTNLQRTLYHPKILGVLFIIIIASLTVRMMSGRMTPDWPAR